MSLANRCAAEAKTGSTSSGARPFPTRAAFVHWTTSPAAGLGLAARVGATAASRAAAARTGRSRLMGRFWAGKWQGQRAGGVGYGAHAPLLANRPADNRAIPHS